MLAVQTYALGSGVCGAQAIVEEVGIDAGLRELCRGDTPSIEFLRRFRNHNRTAVLRCVEDLLRHAWCHHYGQREAAAHRWLAVEILCEARARLHRAERCDTAYERCRNAN